MPVLKSNQTNLKNRLMELTNLSSRDATNLLKSFDWNLDAAIDAHFNSPPASAGTSQLVSELEKVFAKYREDDNTIGIDGTVSYIEDLGYQPEDLTILALAQFLDSPSTGIFKKNDFINTWAREGIASIEQMKEKLHEFDQLLATDEKFLQKVYNFTFGYVLDEGQRSLNPDLAVDYWNLLLNIFDQEKVQKWCQFITEKHNYAISRDQWQMTFEFFLWWRSHDLESYDESLAWPSLMDSFVEDQLGTA